MKILQVIPYFVPAYSYGGTVKVSFDISKELVRRENEVTVVTCDTLDGENRIPILEEVIEGVRVVRFRNISNWLAKKYNAHLPIGFYSWMKANINNFDIVHCHEFFTLLNIITSHLCKKHNIPFIVQPHGSLSPVTQKSRFKWVKKVFLKIFSHVLQNSINIITLTENEKKQVVLVNKNLEEKIVVIPNGIKIIEFQNVSKIDIYKKYNIDNSTKIIGYIGRMQYIKGIDIALEILAGLKNQLDFKYLIIGPDEGEKESLEKKISELGLKNHAIFTGILNGKEKLETIKSCDLFLFTSRSEGLPMTILEVAVLGIPQIISKNCNVPEIDRCEAGFEIDIGDKDVFREKIRYVLANDNLQKKQSQNAIKMVNEYFDLDSVMDKIEKQYHNL